MYQSVKRFKTFVIGRTKLSRQPIKAFEFIASKALLSKEAITLVINYYFFVI